VESRIRLASAVVAMTICMGSTALATGSARAQAPGGTDRQPAAARARMERMRADFVQTRLDSAAERLEIKASQEPAWNAFAAGVKALFAAPPGAAPSEQDRRQSEDAATRLHRRAAAELARAQNLLRLADATSKLQAVLDPNQREVLNQIVRTELDRGPGRFGFGIDGRRGIRMRPMEMGPGPAGMGRGPGPIVNYRLRRQLPDGPDGGGASGASPDPGSP